MVVPDPRTLDLKVGFEIHQQLATDTKLFCNCRCEEAKQYDKSFVRRLRPTQSELGAYDPAAMFEFSKMRVSEYHVANGYSCLVEADEEPPHEVNMEALETALVFSLAFKSKIMDEIHVMRKIVIDGSNTSGFQRTMLIAAGGELEVADKKVGVQSVCLEEDAAKMLGEGNGTRRYGLDRLGVPLIEIALEPVTGRPEEIMQVALTLGRLLRASKRVARGLGSIRQDVNVSIMGGAVVEVKGVQQLDQLVKVIEYETIRQHGLTVIAEKLKARNIEESAVGDRIEDITDVMNKSQSKVVKKIMSHPDPVFRAVKISGFAGMLGFEPHPNVRLGKELGELVRFYDLGGVFHSDELPNYGITQDDIEVVRNRLNLGEKDAFAIIGGPKDRVEYAIDAIVRRLKAALVGVPAETRAATMDGRTVFSRPRPGAARMYPETDIPTIAITKMMLELLANSVPRSWDEVINSIMSRYGLNKKLASQIFDSEYLTVFEKIVGSTSVSPTFVASKITEDIIRLQRQGGDASLLSDDVILDIFKKLDRGTIAKESVVLILEKIMKEEHVSVDDATRTLGASSLSDAELEAALDTVIAENINVVKEKGSSALNMLMGRSMAVLRGKADGQRINALLKEKLDKLTK